MGHVATWDESVVRVEVRFKNARLYDAIIEHDLPILEGKSAAGTACRKRGPVKWFAEFYELSLPLLYDLLNLKASPFQGSSGHYRAFCHRVAVLLERETSWLFPASLYGMKWPRLARNVDAGSASRLIGPSNPLAIEPNQQRVIEANETAEAVGSVLDTLTPRESKLLRLRFGIGTDEQTLDEVGRELGVTRERVRQIELKAMRKLRHPSRARRLLTLISSISEREEARKKLREQAQKDEAQRLLEYRAKKESDERRREDEKKREIADAEIARQCAEKNQYNHLVNVTDVSGYASTVCGFVMRLDGADKKPKCPECMAWLEAHRD